jgi:hypothetical protein
MYALTCARSCLRRGEADASTTLLPRIMFRAGRSKGFGSLGFGGSGGPLDEAAGCGASSYAGGGSKGAFSSAMMLVKSDEGYCGCKRRQMESTSPHEPTRHALNCPIRGLLRPIFSLKLLCCTCTLHVHVFILRNIYASATLGDRTPPHTASIWASRVRPRLFHHHAPP